MAYEKIDEEMGGVTATMNLLGSPEKEEQQKSENDGPHRMKAKGSSRRRSKKSWASTVEV
jgi:hypothetical protein